MSRSPLEAESLNQEDYLAGWNAIHEMIQEGGSWSGRERNCAFLNTGGSRFADVSSVCGLGFPDDGRVVGVVDWDQDGALDMWIGNRSGPRIRFMRNVAGSENHYLAIRLVGRDCNRDAIGARVEVYPRGGSQNKLIKTLRTTDGYLAQSGKWLHFGLGAAIEIERVVVRWPGGPEEEFRGVSADRRYRLHQGGKVEEVQTQKNQESRLAESRLESPPLTERARVVLAARMPVPDLAYKDFDGREVSLIGADDKPVLINLWAVWCAPCLRELSDWSENEQAIRQAGFRVVALNVEDSEAQTAGNSFLSARKWPFEAGIAAPKLLEVLDVLQRGVLDRKRPLPLPTTFLIDAHGRLAVIYKGPVSAEALVRDAAILDYGLPQIRDAAVPFAGRWYLAPAGPDLLAMADGFRRQGLPDIARYYLSNLSGTQGASAGVRNERLASTEYNLGVILGREGRFNEAAEAYRRALQADPTHAEAHINLGIALQNLGDTAGCVEHFFAALSINPDHPAAHHNLAVALTKLGRSAEAGVHAEAARRLFKSKARSDRQSKEEAESKTPPE